jgi:septal ring factor EnvC (AmiA/AmiB activator)
VVGPFAAQLKRVEASIPTLETEIVKSKMVLAGSDARISELTRRLEELSSSASGPSAEEAAQLTVSHFHAAFCRSPVHLKFLVVAVDVYGACRR